MRLHYYAPAVRHSYCVGIHNGHGFGSIFAKLFSKVAAKTAARAAVSVAKSAGKKALKVAAKKGAQLAKEVAKEGLKQAADIGTEIATAKINALADSAIKKNLPQDLVHSIRDAATRGVGTAGKTVKSVGTDKVHGLINAGSVKAEHLGNRLIDKGENFIERKILQHQLPSAVASAESGIPTTVLTYPSSTTTTTTATSRSSTRKRKLLQQPKGGKRRRELHKKKRNQHHGSPGSTSLASILDEA